MNSRPLGIAAGPDGALWFTESAAPGRIGRITTEGDITEYSNGLLLISNPWFISAGPDGNMWFTGNNLPGLGGADHASAAGARRGRRARSGQSRPAARQGPAELAGHLLPLRVRTQRRLRHDDRHGLCGQRRTTWTTCSPRSRDLQPRPKYHYRVVAENDAGITIGPDRVFVTPRSERLEPVLPPARSRTRCRSPDAKSEPEPEFGKTVVADGEGTVRYKAPGGDWQELEPNAELPVGVALDARRGRSTCRTAGCRGDVQAGSLRRRRLLGPPAPRGLRTRGRLPARRQLRELRPGFAPRGIAHRLGIPLAQGSPALGTRQRWPLPKPWPPQPRHGARHPLADRRPLRRHAHARDRRRGRRSRLPAPPQHAGARGPLPTSRGRTAASLRSIAYAMLRQWRRTKDSCSATPPARSG